MFVSHRGKLRINEGHVLEGTGGGGCKKEEDGIGDKTPDKFK